MSSKIKVLFVDDEKLERVLIRRGFPWEENGFEIIGEAGSGREALEFMAHREPDLVLTDINMPNMTGLELSEQIVKKYPKCYVVIVTGYRDFEYARQAVKIGVEDFLLKPVNIEDIKKVAELVKCKLEERRKEEGEVEKLKETLSEEQDVLRETFLNQLVEGRIPSEKAKIKLGVYGYENLEKNCSCINIAVKENSKQEQGSTEEYTCHEVVNNYLREHMPEECVIFIHYLNNIIVFFMSDDKKIAIENAKNIIEDISAKGVNAIIGVSGVHTGFQGIAEAYDESKKALRASVMLGPNRVISYDEYMDIMKSSRPLPRIPWDEFTFAVSNLLYDKVEKLLQEYFINLEKVNNNDDEYLQLMTVDVLSKAGIALNNHSIDLFQLVGEEQLFYDISRIESVAQGQELIKKNINFLMEYLEKKKKKQGNRVVEQALEYINDNFNNPELTLKTVAEKVFSNESYLSRVFKKEVGNSLIEYVTKKRIEESIKLLNTTDLKVYEVAEKVGFRDSHYFSICFKKQVGVTVKEYRNR